MKLLQNEQSHRKGNPAWVYILAFLFPVIIFTAGFALKGVYPFGEESALVVDGVHQYTAFYKELSSQLGKGLGWTYSAHAMGYNFYGLFCYYLSSPFSILVLLLMKFMCLWHGIPEKNIPAEAVWQFLWAVCMACPISCWDITAM